MYDFTQLKNGNLVFVGTKGNSGGVLGVWIIVTDSSGKKMFWEKQCKVVPDSHIPMAVCATPDDGFTMVGGTPGDAFIAHFVPKPVSAVVSRSKSPVKSSYALTIHSIGPRLIVAGNMQNLARTEAALFDMSGRCVAAKTGNKEISFDISNFAKGTYIVRLKAGAATQTMKIAIEQ